MTMTSDSFDESKSIPAAARSLRLEAATLQQWQTELKDFVSQTKQQLNKVSLSMAKNLTGVRGEEPYVVEPPQHDMPSSGEVDSCEGFSASTETPTASTPTASTPTASTATASTPTASTATASTPTASTPAPERAAADPMERLNAIKRRLAQQLENAS